MLEVEERQDYSPSMQMTTEGGYRGVKIRTANLFIQKFVIEVDMSAKSNI